MYLSLDYSSQNDHVFSIRVLAASTGYRLVSALRLKFLSSRYGRNFFQGLLGFSFFVLVYFFNVCLPPEHKNHEGEDHSSLTLQRDCRDGTRLDCITCSLFVAQGLGQPFFTQSVSWWAGAGLMSQPSLPCVC